MPGDDAEKVQFYPLNNIPSLAFDHKKLLGEAIKNIKNEIRHGIIRTDILPENFKLSEIESLHSQIVGSKIEASNLTERLKNFKIILPCGIDGKYCFDYNRYEEILEFGFLSI
jgi:8-oxo-dGTP diphosphatase